MEESLLVMIQFLFEVKLLISTGALITHCFLLMAHLLGNRFLCLSLAQDPVCSWTRGTMSRCASESHFPTHCRNLRGFQDSLTHYFSCFLLTNCRHLFWGIRILCLLSHTFIGSCVKGEQNHLKMSASEMQSLNPACSSVSQAYFCSELSGPAHSELESRGNV